MGAAKKARDGLRARESGPWARRKLEFLDRYGHAALRATTKKLKRVYIDLFAGPGRNLSTAGGAEFEGGAIRAITMRGTGELAPSFTSAYLVNLDPRDHEALVKRIDRLASEGRLAIPREAIHLIHDDSIRVLPDILGQCGTHDYLFVFADPENPSQWPWTAVETLARGGSRSTDLYLLLPLEMGVLRLLNFKGGPHLATQLTRFFGTDEWRAVVGERVSERRAPQLRKALAELYRSRLSLYWDHVHELFKVRRVGNQGLYRMLLATRHNAGERIARWARDDGQEELF